MIKLTTVRGKDLWVNRTHIATMYATENGSMIWLGNDDEGPVEVRESPERILALIEGRER